MKLTELFNRTADWKWLSSSENPFSGYMEPAAAFQTGGVYYLVGFGPFSAIDDRFEDTWMMGFVADIDGEWKENEIGIEGNQFLVFSTIMSIIGDFLKDEQPDALLLGAIPKREKIYTTLIKRKSRELENIGYVPYGRHEATFPIYGRVVVLPLVRKDKLETL